MAVKIFVSSPTVKPLTHQQITAQFKVTEKSDRKSVGIVLRSPAIRKFYDIVVISNGNSQTTEKSLQKRQSINKVSRLGWNTLTFFVNNIFPTGLSN